MGYQDPVKYQESRPRYSTWLRMKNTDFQVHDRIILAFWYGQSSFASFRWGRFSWHFSRRWNCGWSTNTCTMEEKKQWLVIVDSNYLTHMNSADRTLQYHQVQNRQFQLHCGFLVGCAEQYWIEKSANTATSLPTFHRWMKTQLTV